MKKKAVPLKVCSESGVQLSQWLSLMMVHDGPCCFSSVFLYLGVIRKLFYYFLLAFDVLDFFRDRLPQNILRLLASLRRRMPRRGGEGLYIDRV